MSALMDERQFIELFMKSIAEDDNSPLNPDADAPSTSASTFEKTVITEGSGTASPERGARITARVNGELQHLIVNQKVSKYPPAFWDGVKSMKKGEKATLTIADPTSEQKEDSKQTYEVELIYFENVTLVVPNGGIVKKTLRSPQNSSTLKPDYEATVELRWTGKTTDDVVYDEKHVKYVVGEESDIPSLEKVCRSMQLGEVARFILAPRYAYGSDGLPEKGIGPDCVVQYEVELISVVPAKSPWDCKTYNEIYEEAMQRKEQGNAYFKKGNYEAATAKYTKALLYLECAEMENLSEEEKQSLNMIKLHCSNNLAFVALRNAEYDKVIVHCNNALDICPTNPKALYRRGRAYLAQNKWDLAREDFKKAIAEEPSNSDIRQAIMELNSKIAEHEEKEKRTYQKVFKQMWEEDKAQEEASKQNSGTSNDTSSAAKEAKNRRWRWWCSVL